MRGRVIVGSLMMLLLPALELAAQRIRPPQPAGRTPGEPTPLPPQPPEIARQLQYQRLRYSVESYPMATYISAPAFDGSGPITSWTSVGAGSRLDYRVTHHTSVTLDITSSVLGGPVSTQTVELGTRFRRESAQRRLYPFIDARLGYVLASPRYDWPNDIFGNPATVEGRTGRFSSGPGAAAGAGFEYWLNRRFSLTTAASVMHSRLNATRLSATAGAPSAFGMTAFRYTIGLRYNPVRLIMASAQTDAQ